MSEQSQHWSERLQKFLEKLMPYLIKVMDGVELLWQQLTRLLNALNALIQKIPLSPFQWVVVLFASLSLLYLFATPPFEASDELWHFGMVEYIAEEGDLPIQEPGADTPWMQEGSQPPLYYMISAALISPLDISDIEEYREPNPHVQAGIPGNFGNKNLVLRETPFPGLQGTPLAVYVVRLFSLGLGIITIGAVYHSGLLIAPKRPIVGLLAAAITAFNPMFLFISASVNNDNLVTAINSVVIYLMLRLLRDGFDWRRSLLMALLIALGTLSKLSALVILPAVGLAALYVAWRDKAWRDLIILGAAMGILWAGLAGWWYARNLTLYGELFGTSTMAAVAGVRQGEFSLLALISEFQGFRIAYWGLFGAVNIQSGSFFYLLMDIATFTGIFGLIFLMLQLYAIRDFAYARRELINLSFLLLIVLTGLGAVIAWTVQTYASQGRLMFPFVAAISPLLAVGFVEIVWWLLFVIRPPERSFVRADQGVPKDVLESGVTSPIYVLGFFAFIMPLFTIMPQYARPIALDELPESDQIQQVYARYGDVELVGYEVEDRRYLPGEEVPVRLYWRVLEQSERDNSLFVTLIDPFGVEVGKVDTYPGGGRLRTSTWEAGKIYPDLYRVSVYSEAVGRFPLRMQVGWWHYPTETTIRPVDENDSRLDAVVLDVGAVVAGRVAAVEGLTKVEPVMSFGDQFRLLEYGVSDEGLLLYWESIGSPETDYTVFVQALNEDGEVVGQADAPPFLPTRYWRWTEKYFTVHEFQFIDDVEAREYQVIVGWYDADDPDLARLQVGRGDDYPDAAFPLTTIEVDEDGKLVPPPSEDAESTEEPLSAGDIEGTAQANDEATVQAEVEEAASEAQSQSESEPSEPDEAVEPEVAPAPPSTEEE